jgi:hypothetical protein
MLDVVRKGCLCVIELQIAVHPFAFGSAFIRYLRLSGVRSCAPYTSSC